MRVIPVVDVLQTVAVHAVAGDRSRYQPLQLTGLADSSPLELARWYRQRFGFQQIYLADLTAIQQGRPSLSLYDQLADDGFQLLVDPGIRGVDMLDQLGLSQAAQRRQLQWIVGLESVSSEREFVAVAERLADQSAVFSLDFRGGRSLCPIAEWQPWSPEQLFTRVIEAGYRRVLTLDLQRVGVGSGVGTVAMIARFRELAPHVELLAGGGVRGVDDLVELERAGCDAALVATALHRGTITPDHLA